MTDSSASVIEVAREIRGFFERAKDVYLSVSPVCECDTTRPECQAGVARADLGIKIADAIETAPKGFATWARIILREDFP